MKEKIAIIIGAGPAGLTAAHELLEKTNIKPIIFEMARDIGGIAKTICYKGNRIDIGLHRFFSKSEKIMQWWQNVLPLQGAPAKGEILAERRTLFPGGNSADPEKTDKVMLIRNRSSRIFYRNKFFDYPIALNFKTISNLGLTKTARICFSYAKAIAFPIKQEKSLEDFFINRFGAELYSSFFKEYSEKIWGILPNSIKPEWGAQRIKGLSILKAIRFCLKQSIIKDKSLRQKNIETSLIRNFMYPKLGSGQLWEEVARIIKEKGGEINLGYKIVRIDKNGKNISKIYARNEDNGIIKEIEGDYYFSTMPVKDLIGSLNGDAPEIVKKIAQNLRYRAFITISVFLKKLKLKNGSPKRAINDIVLDTWIYIQQKDIKMARLQIVNNWSPYLVKDRNVIVVNGEYFCDEEDNFFHRSDEELIRFCISELVSIGFIDEEDVLDGTVIKVTKAYPGYFGGYDKFGAIKNFTDRIENLFLIGRNGMHRYNNMDHSMLTAMTAVDNIIKNISSKNNIWLVNTEKKYLEER
jgi:protoporphyrinogen oxidase